MVLEQFNYGALRQLLDFDRGTQRLAYMLLLPLVDGVFATMLVSGYVSTFTNIVNAAFTVFAGAGALAVLYSEAETVEQARKMVLKVTPLVLISGAVVGGIAPVFQELFHIQSLQYATGLAIITIALQIAGIEKAQKLSIPAIIITGLVLSYRTPSNIQLTMQYLIPSVATVLTAVSGLYILAGLENRIRLDTIRLGGALVLLMIAGSLFGLSIPSEAGIAVLTASIIFSLR